MEKNGKRKYDRKLTEIDLVTTRIRKFRKLACTQYLYIYSHTKIQQNYIMWTWILFHMVDKVMECPSPHLKDVVYSITRIRMVTTSSSASFLCYTL